MVFKLYVNEVKMKMQKYNRLQIFKLSLHVNIWHVFASVFSVQDIHCDSL